MISTLTNLAQGFSNALSKYGCWVPLSILMLAITGFRYTTENLGLRWWYYLIFYREGF